MELLEVMDEKGNPTGEILQREIIHDRNLLHNEIAVYIINEKKQVLLQKRSASKRFDPNKWGSCAGHVPANETLIDSALRELKEEVGMDITKAEIHCLIEKEILKKETNSHIIYSYYIKSNIKEEDFTIQKEELSEVKWFDIDKLIKMIKAQAMRL